MFSRFFFSTVQTAREQLKDSRFWSVCPGGPLGGTTQAKKNYSDNKIVLWLLLSKIFSDPNIDYFQKRKKIELVQETIIYLLIFILLCWMLHRVLEPIIFLHFFPKLILFWNLKRLEEKSVKGDI